MSESHHPPTPEWLQPAIRAGAERFKREQRFAQEQAALAREKRLRTAGEKLLHAEYGAKAQAEAETMSADIIRLFSQQDIEPYPQPSYKFEDHAQTVRIRNLKMLGHLTRPVPPKRPKGQSASTEHWGWDITNSNEEWFLENFNRYSDTTAGGLFLDHLGTYRVVAEIGYSNHDHITTREKYGVQRVVWDPRLHAELLAQGEKTQLFPTLYPKVQLVTHAQDKTGNPGEDAIMVGQITDEGEQYTIWISKEQSGRNDLGRPRLPDKMLGHVMHATYELVNNFSEAMTIRFDRGDRLLEPHMRLMAISHGAFDPPQ